MHIIAWTREPRLGEAGKPGPNAAFDCESADAWSEYDDPFQQAPEQPDCWMLPPSELEAELFADDHTQWGVSTGVLPA